MNVPHGHQSIHSVYMPAKSQDAAGRQLGSSGLIDKHGIEVLVFVAVMLAELLIIAA